MCFSRNGLLEANSGPTWKNISLGNCVRYSCTNMCLETLEDTTNQSINTVAFSKLFFFQFNCFPSCYILNSFIFKFVLSLNYVTVHLQSSAFWSNLRTHYSWKIDFPFWLKSFDHESKGWNHVEAKVSQIAFD